MNILIYISTTSIYWGNRLHVLTCQQVIITSPGEQVKDTVKKLGSQYYLQLWTNIKSGTGLNMVPTLPTYLLTHSLTHSMVQSPSWKANWFAASQEIPRISRNPKVHYRTHKLKQNMSGYLTPRTVFINTKLFAGLWVLLCFHSVRWESYGIASLGFLCCRNM